MSDNEEQEQEVVIEDEPEDPDFIPTTIDGSLLA